MTLIVPPGFANAAFTFTGAVGTQPYITTLGFQVDLGATTAVEVANGVMGSYAAVMASETSSGLVLDRVSLYVGDDGPSGSVDSDLSPVAMTRSGSYPPTACSAIARKVTASVGRRGRGRMFLPGVLSESEIDQDGSVVTTRRGTLNAALDNLRLDLLENPGVVDLALFHSSAPTDPSLITGLVCSDLVGWIRGRIR